MSLFVYFWAGTQRSYCAVVYHEHPRILHQHSQIFLNKKFQPKIKIP